MNSNQENTNLLKELINENNLNRFSYYILNNSPDSIIYSFNRKEKETDIKLGSSKFGGVPHFPKGYKWSEYEEDETPYEENESIYKAFIGQINCEEIKSFDTRNLLPQTGILYLFDNSIIYFDYPHISELEILEKPEGLEQIIFYDFSYEDEVNKNCIWLLSFKLGINIPDSLPFHSILEPTSEERINFEKFQLELYRNKKLVSKNQILGLQHCEYRIDNYEEEKEIPLIEIPSISELGLNWACHGYNFSFWIKEEDLINKDFSNIRIDENDFSYQMDTLPDDDLSLWLNFQEYDKVREYIETNNIDNYKKMNLYYAIGDYNKVEEIIIQNNPSIDELTKIFQEIVPYTFAKNIEKHHNLLKLLNDKKVKKNNIILPAYNIKTREFLLENNIIDINATDWEGKTRLLHDIRERNTEGIKFLLDTGASLDIKDGTGKKAIDYILEQARDKYIIENQFFKELYEKIINNV